MIIQIENNIVDIFIFRNLMIDIFIKKSGRKSYEITTLIMVRYFATYGIY